MIDEIGVSYGTLTLLGLKNAQTMVEPTTAHFMIGEGCTYSCKFCSQAKCSHSSPHLLSRVIWPKRAWSDLASPLDEAISGGLLKRACLQIVESPGATNQAIGLIRQIRAISDTFPISVCVVPTSVARVELFFQSGASRVGLPLDAACPRIYSEIKGREFTEAWDVLKKASKRWPGRISTHLIVGIGETEEEMARCIADVNSLGITVGLFAFTPVRGTQMQHVPAPSLASYRRVQLVSHILRRGGRLEQISFKGGKIASVEISSSNVLDEVKKGIPFQTSGCAYCNRPYYNERPGQIPMNYPRALSKQEAHDCLLQSQLNVG